MFCLLKIPTKNGLEKPLNEEHVVFIIQNAGGNHLTTINDMLESFYAQFECFSIKKFAIYSYMREECQLSLKRIRTINKRRNAEHVIKIRKDWILRW